MRKLTAGRSALFLVGFYLLSGGVQAKSQTVTSLTLNPSSIAGGSGGSSTGTVTLSIAAPAGGTAVTISSSNTDLAASVPSLTVLQGATSATFTVGTNALYRRYSGLGFTVNISASANGSTASAPLTVTAQARPPDITGDSCQREGFVCGGAFPAGQGEAGILYQCFVAPTCNGMNGACTFSQECPLGCQTNPPNGFKFSDACATTGPFPVALSPNYVVGGNSSAGKIQLSAPAPSGSSAAANTNNVFSSVSAVDPLPAGATSAGFTVFTEPVAVPNFAGIYGAYTTPVSGFNRIGLDWLTFVPPPGDPPAAISNFTLSPTTVVAGQASQATITLTKAAPAGGAIVKLGSSDYTVVSVPTTTTVPAGATTFTFPVCTVGPGSASIAAAYGGVIKKAGITTTASPTLTITSFTLSPSTVVGGGSSTATITLSGPASCSGTEVFPSSSSSAASVPGIVTVPTGATSTSFTVSTTQVTSCTSVSISLFFGGVVARSSTLTLTPPGGSCVAVSSLALNPSSVVGGNSSIGTVTLNAAAPASGAVVSLGVSPAGTVTVPASVTVPGGATSANFTATTSSVSATTVVSIFASFGAGSPTASLTVNPAASATPGPVSLALNPTSVSGSGSSTGTVTLSAAAPAGGAAVALASSNTAVATVPASVTVAAGTTSTSFTASAKLVTGSAIISATSGGITKTATLNVTTAGDTVSVTLAQYDTAKQQLQAQATSTSTSATLQVFVTATNALIGTLANKGGGNYEGLFSLSPNPSNITVRSSLGGSATRAVTAK